LTSAIFKLVAQAGTCPPQAAAVIDEYTRSKDVDLQQRCLEFQALLTTAPQYLGDLLPVDASAEDLQVDASLSFLDDYCQDALTNGSGARPYDKPLDDDDDDDDDYNATLSAPSAFKLTPYAKPETNVSRSHAVMARGMGAGGPGGGSSGGGGGVTLPPGSHTGTTAQGTTQVTATGDGLVLNTRGAANVWGKKPAQPPPAASQPQQRSSFDTTPQTTSNNNNNPYASSSSSSFGAAAANNTSSSSFGGGGGGGFGASAAPPASSIPEKTPEQLEKERMAAALFGGMVPGAPPPPPRPAAPVPSRTPPVVQQHHHAPAPAPPPAPAPAPPPVEIDLLDMGAFEVVPQSSNSGPVVNDIFGATTLEATPPPSALAEAPPPPPTIVETVSDDDDVDPFAAQGLLSDLTDAPLKSFESSSVAKFEYNGNVLNPLPITTAQFGQQWGSCPATSPVSIQNKATSLERFMKECQSVGLHPIEAIGATNEGICAGRIGTTANAAGVVLIHGKIAPPNSVVITVKSADPTLSGSLALYLQNMMK
jgi:AP-4 complex subunit epsilon-1